MFRTLSLTGLVLFGLGLLCNHYSIISSFFINLSAGAVTILFTVLYVDKLLKLSEDNKKVEEEKYRIYESWKDSFTGDKQSYSRYMGEIAEMIDILGECYNNKPLMLEEKEICLMVNLLETQIRVKLVNPPLKYSFQHTERMVMEKLEMGVEDIILEIANLLENIERYIKIKEPTVTTLKEFSRELFKSRLKLLSLMPKRYEDLEIDKKC